MLPDFVAFKVSKIPETVVLERLVEKLEEVVVVGYSMANGYKPLSEKLKNPSLNNPPQFPGGVTELYRLIGSNLRYPAIAQRANIEGDVHVIFNVDTEGKAVDPKILKGIGFGCDEEAMRVVSLLPFAAANNKKSKVSVLKNIHIDFKLPKIVEAKVKPATQQIKYSITPTQTKDPKPNATNYNYTITID